MPARNRLCRAMRCQGAFLFFFGFVSPTTAFADDLSDSELRGATQQVSVVVENARKNLLPLMSNNARDTDAKLTYSFVSIWNSNAQATPNGRILISGGI